MAGKMENGYGELGGVAGGLLRILRASGTALVAIIVGWRLSKRVDLKARVIVGGIGVGAFVGLIVALLFPSKMLTEGTSPEVPGYAPPLLGSLVGCVVGLLLAVIVNSLLDSFPRE